MPDRGPDEIIRAKLVELIDRLPENTRERRTALYEQARRVFQNKYPDHLTAFDSIVRSIEAGYEPVAERRATPLEAEEPSPVRPAERERAEFPKALAALTGLAILVAAGVWFYLGSGSIQEFDEGLVGYTDNLKTMAPIVPDGGKLTLVNIAGDKVIEARGNTRLIAIDPIAVHRAKTYRVRARIRVIRNDPKFSGSRIFVGVATFDKDGKIETEMPGANRYAAMAGTIVKASEKWIDVEGLITGEGNGHNQFGKGTVYVRPLILLNHRTEDAVTQVTSLSIEEVAAK